jgi:hypothetical protein
VGGYRYEKGVAFEGGWVWEEKHGGEIGWSLKITSPCGETEFMVKIAN